MASLYLPLAERKARYYLGRKTGRWLFTEEELQKTSELLYGKTWKQVKEFIKRKIK